MCKNKYKIETFRTNGNVIQSAKSLEIFLNDRASAGWRVLSSTYHASLLCCEILFEKIDGEEEYDG